MALALAMPVDDVIKVVAQLGFPIFVAVFLLLRLDKVLNVIVQHGERQRELLGEVRDLLRALQASSQEIARNGQHHADRQS